MPGIANADHRPARPRLALRDAVLRRDADPHRPRPGRGAEVASSCKRALDAAVEGIRQDRRRRARRRASRRSGRSSDEENLRPMDGSGLRAAGTPGARRRRPAPRAPPRSTASRQDLTAKAASRQDGPDRRPRRRDPPDHRRADAPPAEQPDPHRRGRRRQDRGGRGLCPAASPPATCRRSSRACGSARSTSA